MEYRLYLMVFLLGISNSKTSALKSSLTFVIDDTGSMKNDIEQVKAQADAIFDTVVNSNRSHIEDFVLVTFNDPDVSFRTRTKDRRMFKDALKSIIVGGGDDCPENAMKGIELALQNSRDGSQLYVFTDASAKDHKEVEKVKDLAQKKQAQIVFVLTGMCSSIYSADYKAYVTLAKATNGAVFHMGKEDVGSIIEFVKSTIDNRKYPIASKAYPAGYGHEFDVKVDGETKELFISVSGTNPSVGVKDSTGTRMPVHDITRLTRVAYVRVPGVKPGIYKVEVGSNSETDVTVSGTTTVHFQHGFSVFEPTTITETTKQPVPDEKSYLSVKLETEGGDVELQEVQILELDGGVVVEKSVKLLNDAEQFYVSTEPILPPKDTFLVAIRGYHIESGTYITRISLTRIESQKIFEDRVHEKAAVVSVDVDKIEAKYKEKLQLKCKVSGYPRPDIIWESDDHTAVLAYTDSVVELPYEYISILNVNAKKPSTYKCKAVNKMGMDSKKIAVEMEDYFNVLDKPYTDSAIEYKTSGQLSCRVDAYPPAKVTWYKDGRLLATDSNVALSTDHSVLTISSMQPTNAGNYICEARNLNNRNLLRYKVSITGAEKPKINKNLYAVTALENSNAELNCELIRGQPAPSFAWYYSAEYSPSSAFVRLDERGPSLTISDVERRHAGSYRCLVANELGRDQHVVYLAVEFKPEQTAKVPARVAANVGDSVSLACPVTAMPPPGFRWLHAGRPLPPHHKVYRDGTLRFVASLDDAGNYECEARNDHGAVRINVEVDINDPVYIEIPKRSSVLVTVGEPLTLPCRAHGAPAPSLQWLFHSSHSGASETYLPNDSSGSLHLKRVQPAQDGFYTCVATNAGGSKNITYTVSVLVPPFIRNTGQTFSAVAGDWSLRVTCDAGGNPAPTVTWAKNGHLLPLDSEWYGAEGHDLILRALDARAAGLYTCRAENSLAAASHAFRVNVEPYPTPGEPEETTWLEEEQAVRVPCAVPHGSTDRLVWFKDGRMISDSELAFKSVSRRDEGLYSCRVSSAGGARGAHSRLRVGWRPRFLLPVSPEDTDIQYDVGNFALLDCDANAHPEPEIQWFHEDVPLPVSGATHEVTMTGPRDQGRYKCVVTNKFGTIQREFLISSQECILDVKKDFDGYDPLMLTRYLDLKPVDTTDGQLRITRGDSATLVCPTGFKAIPQRLIQVECLNDKQFSYDGRRYSYSDLKCRGKLIPKMKRTGRSCAKRNTEMTSVGFELPGKFVEVYQVCMDLATRDTVYTKHDIGSSMSEVEPDYVNWFDEDRGSIDMESLYDCGGQRREMWKLGVKDGCCLARRQLVSARDVPPALRAATHARRNVAPQWGTCNYQNWEEIETRIRGLARSSHRTLRVYSGAAMALSNVTLAGKPVPQYFWKVVDDEVAGEALAIVQVNVPGLQLRDAAHYRLCRDVCEDTDWMRGRLWRSVQRGYTYCCRVEDLAQRLGLQGALPGRRRLLAAAGHLPDSSALHLT